jgi:hypothetical protein
MSDTIACVGKNMPINAMVISGVKKELTCLTKSLKGTVARDFLTRFLN